MHDTTAVNDNPQCAICGLPICVRDGAWGLFYLQDEPCHIACIIRYTPASTTAVYPQEEPDGN